MQDLSKLAALYVRISADPSKTQLGVRRQEADLRREAKRRGVQVVLLLEDNDLSASGKDYRPDFERLLEGIQRGEIGLVMAYDLDRLNRGMHDYVRFYDACEKAKVTVAWIGGEANFATGTGIFEMDLRASFAREELRKIRSRTGKKMAELVAAGKWTGGARPFGWQADGMTLQPDEAKELRKAKDRILGGESLYAVYNDWLKRGIHGTRKGAIIRASTLKRMLTSPRLIGRNGIGKAQWAPIFTEDDEFRQLCSILNSKGGSRPTRTYMLTGKILKCGKCGAPMYGGEKKYADKPYYTCKKIHGNGCAGVAIPVQRADEMVMIRLVDYLNSKEFAKRLTKLRADNPGLGKAALELEKVEAKLAEIGADRDADVIPRSEYLERRGKLAGRLEAAKGALEAARAEVAGLADLAALAGGKDYDPSKPFGAWLQNWDELDVDGRRRAILGLVERVTILPHKGSPRIPDPDRVEVTFRA